MGGDKVGTINGDEIGDDDFGDITGELYSLSA